MFTKSLNNMQYGRHIDNPFMSSGRADLSFTIFLTDKNSYEGGELIIEELNSEKEFKQFSSQINEKLINKGIILRSTENGYKIKNMLRLTIGSKIDNLKFMNAVESIFRQ